MSDLVTDITQRLESTARATREELVALLAADGEATAAVCAAADRVRAAAVGDEVHLRGLIEFSSRCRRNCRYCGLRRDHIALARYQMSPSEVLNAARQAAALGYRTIVLQSGEDASYDSTVLGSLIQAIKSEHDVAVTLCVGERPEEDYRLLREAGADRYLLRIETSSPALYEALHPDSNWYARMECLRSLRRLGYQVGSGVLIGLPGQTVEMLADDLLFLQALDLDMMGVGPFVAHPQTPLGGEPSGGLALTLRFVACLRLLCPQALIPATTALGSLDQEGQRLALQAGADVIMPNATPLGYRRQYQLYPGKAGGEQDEAACRRLAEELISDLGRVVARDHGHSRRLLGVTTL